MKNAIKTFAIAAAFGLAFASCSNTSSPKIPVQGYYDTSTPSGGETGSGGTGGGAGGGTTTTPGENTTTYIGSHKPTETKKVGDIIFSDGSFERLNEILVMSTYQQSNAVAVIFYVGTSSDVLGEKTLGVSLLEEQKVWISSQTAEGYKDVAVNESDGTVNTNAIKAKSDYNETNYPAFYWADKYNAKGFSSGWYLPAAKELKALYDQKAKVNSAIENLKVASNYSPYAKALSDNIYWTSTQCIVHYAYTVRFANGEQGESLKDTTSRYVRAIRAF